MVFHPAATCTNYILLSMTLWNGVILSFVPSCCGIFCEVVEVLPSCNGFCGILVSYTLLLLFFIVYVHGQNLAPPDCCNILKNKINFIWKKILVLYVFTGLKNNMNHEKKSDENTPVESPLSPLQNKHSCLHFCLNLMPLILVLGTLSHRLIWMVMMIMLDLNFPFLLEIGDENLMSMVSL